MFNLPKKTLNFSLELQTKKIFVRKNEYKENSIID